MGMFDWVIVEDTSILPIEPEISKQLDKFQSTDLDCILASIKITKEGRLHIQRFTITFENNTFRRINLDWEDLNYQGSFVFYTLSYGKWYKFDAKFAGGKLETIERLEGKNDTLF